ncbi:MAG: undecaprenyldiphospho-muramoylpentapeptide beta-N-acetylglucosaminyltransferase [Candidatus Brocadiia bacterium]
MSYRMILTAGGTGGHIMPGIALGKYIQSKGCEVLWIGAEGGLESETVPKAGIEYRSCGMKRVSGGILPFIRRGFSALAALPKTNSIIKAFKPDAVVGMGGYASVPTLTLSYFKGIPYFLLEQNAIPGSVTRRFAGGSKRVFAQFAEARDYLPKKTLFEHSGTPLRESFLRRFPGFLERNYAHGEVLLVLGGSQGSRALNKAMVECLPVFELEFPGFRVIHLTGNDDFAEVSESYKGRAGHEVHAFCDNMDEIYARSTVALTRAGAVTLAELALAALPAIIVPFPQAADNHQRANAEVYRRAGAARVIQQRELSARKLVNEFKELCHDTEKRSSAALKMRDSAKPEATQTVGDSLISFLEKKAGK